jgi:hypothetical protein
MQALGISNARPQSMPPLFQTNNTNKTPIAMLKQAFFTLSRHRHVFPFSDPTPLETTST